MWRFVLELVAPTDGGTLVVTTAPLAEDAPLSPLMVVQDNIVLSPGQLHEWARGHGATDGYLQVSDGNASAIAMYQRLGFTEHHRYRYRRLPTLR